MLVLEVIEARSWSKFKTMEYKMCTENAD